MSTRYVIKAYFCSPSGKLVVPLWHNCHSLFQALALVAFLEKQGNVTLAEAFSYKLSDAVEPKDVEMVPLTNPWPGLGVMALKCLAEPADKFTAWTSDMRCCYEVLVPTPALDQDGQFGCLSFHTQHTNDANAAKNFVDHLFQSRVIAGYRALSARSQFVLHGPWLVRGKWTITNPKYQVQSLIETVTED